MEASAKALDSRPPDDVAEVRDEMDKAAEKRRDNGNGRLKLGQFLVQAGSLELDQLEHALVAQAGLETRERLGQVLVREGLCTEDQIADAIAGQLGMSRVDPSSAPMWDDALRMLGRALCVDECVIPIETEVDGHLLVMDEPPKLEILDFVRRCLPGPVHPAVATRSEIASRLSELGDLHDPFESMIFSAARAVEAVSHGGSATSIEVRACSTPAIRLVDELLARGIEHGASDIHVEAGLRDSIVRYRIDGVLGDAASLPRHLHETVVARIKVMSEMDIVDRRRPQDGHATIRVGGRRIDLRVSTLPTVMGENAVLRILASDEATVCGLDETGMLPEQTAVIRDALALPQGCFIVSGPTGSGKSTTLHACLAELDPRRLNLSTIEDPVERRLARVNQTQVCEPAGMTFAAGLRALLRQDPDVIMVGEIRDQETASIAMRAAITGHLVLTTLHTTGAPACVSRLRDLGVEDYLISASLSLVMAQRLVRKLCPHCRVARAPDGFETRFLANLDDDPVTAVFDSPGCRECFDRGYRGRISVAEVLPMTDNIQLMVSQGRAEAEVRAEAEAIGTIWMPKAGLRHVAEGTTSVRELARAVPQ